jgi:hypothetical protein
MKAISKIRLNILTNLSDDRGHKHGDISLLLGPKDEDRSGKKKKGYDGHDKGDLTKTLQSMVTSKLIRFESEHYYITQTKETFSYILDQSKKNGSDKFYKSFLESKYINSLIRTIGFKSLFAAMSGHLADRGFRDIAAPALLSHAATIEEYKSLISSIEEYFENMENLEEIKKEGERFLQDQASGSQSGPAQVRSALAFQRSLEKQDGALYDNKTGKIDELEILKEFGIEGVRFYRNNLLAGFIHILSGRMGNAENGKHIIKYAELDNRLSPFTAFPVNNPIEMMSSTSFSRLYEDAYLIDPKDTDFLLDRANVIFDNFQEFARLFIASKNYKGAAIRGLIHDWNIASARLEVIHGLIVQFVYCQDISGIHLTKDSAGFQIVNLETGERLLGEADLESLDADNLNRGFHEFDQTKYIRPVLLENLGQSWKEKLVPIYIRRFYFDPPI